MGPVVGWPRKRERSSPRSTTAAADFKKSWPLFVCGRQFPWNERHVSPADCYISQQHSMALGMPFVAGGIGRWFDVCNVCVWEESKWGHFRSGGRGLSVTIIESNTDLVVFINRMSNSKSIEILTSQKERVGWQHWAQQKVRTSLPVCSKG
jgi:hypothetical protein